MHNLLILHTLHTLHTLNMLHTLHHNLLILHILNTFQIPYNVSTRDSNGSKDVDGRSVPHLAEFSNCQRGVVGLVTVKPEDHGTWHIVLLNVVAEIHTDLEHCVLRHKALRGHRTGPLSEACGGDVRDAGWPILYPSKH